MLLLYIVTNEGGVLMFFIAIYIFRLFFTAQKVISAIKSFVKSNFEINSELFGVTAIDFYFEVSLASQSEPPNQILPFSHRIFLDRFRFVHIVCWTISVKVYHMAF